MKKNHLALLLFGLVCTIIFTSCGSSSEPLIDQISLNENRLILDIYQEYDLIASNYTGELTWTSSDPTVATVDDNGHLSCQGKVGETTIEAASLFGKTSALIITKNQLITPNISVEDTVAFVDVTTKPNVNVRYDGNYYPIDTYELTSEDPNIVTVVDDSLKGMSLGETTVFVDAIWKGKTLSTKNFVVDVLPEKTIILDEDVYDIYSVDETSTAKKNEIEVNGLVYIRGEVTDEPILVSLSSNDYLSIEENVIKVINPYAFNNPLVILGEVYVESDPSIREYFTINLHSNFESKTSINEITETFLSDINLTTVDFGGRTDVLKYEIPNVPVNQNKSNPTWTDWNTRIEFYETTTKNGVAAYDEMMEKGYALLAVDLYYTGIKGILIGAYGAGAKDYFYNEVQVNRGDILLVNDQKIATNTLTNDQWYTLYVKISPIVLASMVTGQVSSALYIAPCFINDITYLDNIRYYYDEAPLEDITYAIDLEERTLAPDSENLEKANVLNEFVVYSPNYIHYSRIGDESAYTYDSTSAKSMDRELRSKIMPANVLNAKAVKEGYRYLSFEFEYITGSPIIYIFDVFKQANVSMMLTPATTVNTDLIEIYSNGQKIDHVIANHKVMIVVKIDGRSGDSMYMTSSVNTIFKLDKFAYFKNGSYYTEFAYLQPLKVISDNIDIAFVDDSFRIEDLISVQFNGQLTKAYQINNVSFSQPLALYSDGSITFIATGDLVVEVQIEYEGFTITIAMAAKIYDSSYLKLFDHHVEIYAGERDYFVKTYDIKALAFLNKLKLEDDDLNIELVTDNGSINIDNNLVTAVKEGYEKVKVSIGTGAEEISDYIEFYVFNEYRKGDFSISVSDATNPATYSQTSEIVFGVTNPFLYSAPVASWNNKLDVTLTNHTDPSAYRNILNNNLKYVTFDFLLTPGTTGRLAAIAPNGIHTMLKLTSNGIIEGDNTNIKIYLDGNQVTSLTSNTWYKVVVNYSNFKQEYLRGYTCTEFGYVKGNIYINDVRYYHEEITDFS